MGHTWAVPIKSHKAKADMLNFMQTQYRKWDHVSGINISGYAIGPTDDLEYDNGKCRIGFHSNCLHPESEYIHSICMWMALRVGRKRKLLIFRNTGVFDVVPYLVYDGYETWPVRLKSTWLDRMPTHGDWTYEFVNEDGLISNHTSAPMSFGVRLGYAVGNMVMKAKKNRKLIQTELARLSKAWDQRQSLEKA